jgi:hypothetical protein
VSAVAATVIGDALDEAIRLIEHGWTQGAYCRTKSGAATIPAEGSAPHRVDLAFALQRGAELHGLNPEILRQLVQAELPAPHSADNDFGLERWNDEGYRRPSEILIVLRRVREREW